MMNIEPKPAQNSGREDRKQAQLRVKSSLKAGRTRIKSDFSPTDPAPSDVSP